MLSDILTFLVVGLLLIWVVYAAVAIVYGAVSLPFEFYRILTDRNNRREKVGVIIALVGVAAVALAFALK